MIDEDFLTLLASILPANTQIEKGKISMERIPQRVYFQQGSGNSDVFLNRTTAGLVETTFDVEVAALSDDSTAQSMMSTIKSSLNGYQGAFGTSNVSLGMFVMDHTDDYQPLLHDQDEGYFIASAQVTIYT